MAKQMDLFKSKRQRGKAPPAPSEFLVHVSLADTLRRWLSPGWIFIHYPAGEERPAKITAEGKRFSPAAERLKRMGTRDGVSDFLLFGPPTARLHSYELKKKGKRPTALQLAWGDEVLAAGGRFDWGDSYDHAVRTFQDWGALPTTIKVQ